jgi:hypothetical protein
MERRHLMTLKLLALTDRLVLKKLRLWTITMGALALVSSPFIWAQEPPPPEALTVEVGNTVEIKKELSPNYEGKATVVKEPDSSVAEVTPQEATGKTVTFMVKGKKLGITKFKIRWEVPMMDTEGTCEFEVRVVPLGSLPSQQIGCGTQEFIFFNRLPPLDTSKPVSVLISAECEMAQLTLVTRGVPPESMPVGGPVIKGMPEGRVVRVFPDQALVLACSEGQGNCSYSLGSEVPAASFPGQTVACQTSAPGYPIFVNKSSEDFIPVIQVANKCHGPDFAELNPGSNSIAPGEAIAYVISVRRGESVRLSCPGTQGEGCTYAMNSPGFGSGPGGVVACGMKGKEIYKNETPDRRQFVNVQVTNKCQTGDSVLRVFDQAGSQQTTTMNDMLSPGQTRTFGFDVPPGGRITLDCGDGRRGEGCFYTTMAATR